MQARQPLPTPVHDLLQLTSQAKPFALIPASWASAGLPDYLDFVKSHPSLFGLAPNPLLPPSVVQVSCLVDRMLAVSRLAADPPAVLSVSAKLAHIDPYAEILNGLDSSTRAALVSPQCLSKAAEALNKVLRRSPHGILRSEAERAVQQACGLPVPLEWFSDQAFIPHNRVFERSVAKPGDVCNLLGERDGVDVLELVEEEHELDEVIARIEASGNLHFAPHMVYSRSWPGDYLKASALSVLPRAAVQLQKSAFSVLIEHVEKEVRAKRRLKTADVQHWCSLLGVSGKWLYGSIRQSVVWSSMFSDLQILVRKKPLRIPTTVPYQVGEKILEKVKSGTCQIDLLTRELKWTKTSELRIKYGPLHEVLRKIPEIFFEPEHMYDREYLLREVVTDLPDWDKQKESRKSHFDQLFVARKEVHDLLVRELATSGKMEIHQLTSLCQARELSEDLFFGDRELFFPLKNIFRLRAKKEAAGSVDNAVMAAFEKTGAQGIDMDALLKSLGEVGFAATEIEAWRSTLSSDMHADDALFFHDMYHIYPLKAAEAYLQGGPFQRTDASLTRAGEGDAAFLGLE